MIRKHLFIPTALLNIWIYVLNKENTNHEFICGGSIIASNPIISGNIFFLQEIKIN